MCSPNSRHPERNRITFFYSGAWAQPGVELSEDQLLIRCPIYSLAGWGATASQWIALLFYHLLRLAAWPACLILFSLSLSQMLLLHELFAVSQAGNIKRKENIKYPPVSGWRQQTAAKCTNCRASLIGNKPLAFAYSKKAEFQPTVVLPGSAFMPRDVCIRSALYSSPGRVGQQAPRRAAAGESSSTGDTQRDVMPSAKERLILSHGWLHHRSAKLINQPF